MGSSNRRAEQKKQMAELSKNLKEGERILEPTRRPDGTLRKPIRIRAGHVPEDEVVIYQSKGTAGEDTEKIIRALKKKIRLTEAQQQKKTAPQDLKPEQVEKIF